MKLHLRPYQEQGVYCLDRAINAGEHPLCVHPTGSGKSVVLAALLHHRDQNALVLSHTAELLEQDARALKRYSPKMTQSFFSAGLGEKKLGTQIVFGSVQSVYRNLHRFKKARPLILIDEAHLCPRDSESMYARVFAHFATSQRIGFTATPMRLDTGSLIDGKDAWFTSVAHEAPIKGLIDDGYLLPLSGVIAEEQANLAAVHTRAGEFMMEEAQAAVMDTLSLPQVIKRICHLAQRRKSWLVFASGIKHAKQISAQLTKAGISNATIFGDTESQERSDRIDEARTGGIRALINVGVLTTGFDNPSLDCIISLRPTKSPVLWAQMLGRGMRLFQGKHDCLLLDFVGNLDRLGGAGAVTQLCDMRTPDAIKQAKREAAKRKAKAPVNPPVFFDASHRDPMSSGDAFDAEVHGMSFFIINSRKQPGKRMLCATYQLEDEYGRAFAARAFISVEYAGAARYFAEQWFARRGVVREKVPRDAVEALVIAQGCWHPTEVKARFDARLKMVVIEQEFFE